MWDWLSRNIDGVVHLVGGTLILGFAIGCWVFSSWCEAAAFNRITGKDVTTWDAMFVTLRVQEGVAND